MNKKDIVTETFTEQAWTDKSGQKSRLLDEEGHGYFSYRHRKNELKATEELKRWTKYKCNQNKRRKCTCSLQIRREKDNIFFARGGEHNHRRRRFQRKGKFTKFTVIKDNAKAFQIGQRRRKLHIERQREILVDLNKQKTPLGAILTPEGKRKHERIINQSKEMGITSPTRHCYRKMQENLQLSMSTASESC